MKRVVEESSLVLPSVTMGRSIPSFTDEELWDFLMSRGVKTPNPQFMRYCFKDLVHREGWLMYSLKPDLADVVRIVGGEEVTLFEDTSEYLLSPNKWSSAEDRHTYFVVKRTHDKNGLLIPKNAPYENTVAAYDDCALFMNPSVPMAYMECTVNNSNGARMFRDMMRNKRRKNSTDK